MVVVPVLVYFFKNEENHLFNVLENVLFLKFRQKINHRNSLFPLQLVCNVLLTYCCGLVWVKSVIGESQEEAVDGKMGIIRFRFT